jgi:hypothetical protein
MKIKMLLFLSILLVGCKKLETKELSKSATSLPNLNSGGVAVSHYIQVANPGENNDIQPSLLAALNKAVNGDVLILPQGTFVFNTTLLVTKSVSISGAGADKTILHRPESVSDALLASDDWRSFITFYEIPSNSGKIRISDLCLRSKKPCIIQGDGGSIAADFGIRMIKCLDFVITRCRFENFGNAAISVQHDDVTARGLIQKNQFYHNVKGPDGLGLGYGILIFGTNTQWVADPKFGTSNFIFVEDNTFDFHRHSIAAGGCALYVFRHNTVINNNIGRNSGQAIDAHEAREVPGSNYYSSRAVEIYNNTITNTTTKTGALVTPGLEANQLVENAILIRGGEALIHDNIIKGYRFGVGVINFEVGEEHPYPIFTQIGYLSGRAFEDFHTGINMPEGNGDLFTWNNTVTSYPGQGWYASSAFYNYMPDFFWEGRDYHFVAKPQYTSYPYPHPGF